MSIETTAQVLRQVSSREVWFSLSDIEDRLPVDRSHRQVLRDLQELTGQLITELDDVRDGLDRPLRALVLPHLRTWLVSKRKKARILQFLEREGLIALTDLRGRSEFRRLPTFELSSVEGALSELADAFLVIPHAAAHKLLAGKAWLGNHEVLEAAHLPLAFQPTSAAAPTSLAHPHLKQLENESIQVIREAVAAAERPAMLFSMGKDSMVMLRLAEKAFAPEPVPFPIVMIDTRWKFQEMYSFRAWIEARPDLDVMVHINPDAIERDVNPFDFGSAGHTDITKTQALKQILDDHRFDFVFGGARRDEEKSRAKERIFSVRDSRHGWDPRNQRPEFWDCFNTSLTNGQSMRVFPLSNWTELDVWRYLEAEQLPLVPLYFARRRAFVERDGSLIMIDDDRFRLEPNEQVQFESIRFRTLGCYPLTGGMMSAARSIQEVVAELEATRLSERSSRVIDFDRGASMEQKKREGYF